MHDYLFYLALTSAIFAGAVVSGFAGFAFSAVAGVILMHLLAPHEAVPLMMACSIAVQLIGMVTLRSCMNWRSSLPFLAGGAAGIPPAVYLLHHMDTWTLRIGFGRVHRRLCLLHARLPDIFVFSEQPACGRCRRGWVCRRADRRAYGDAWRGADHLVQPVRHAQGRTARRRPTLHYDHAMYRHRSAPWQRRLQSRDAAQHDGGSAGARGRHRDRHLFVP